MLQDLGLDVSTARNGQEALDQFKKSKLYTFDYIFMDIMMPIKNGLEATREIRVLPRRDAKSVHILAMSANAFESDIQECLKAGMDGHIAKPITIELLKENLNFFVDIQIEMCGLLSFLIIGQLFIGICFWRYL